MASEADAASAVCLVGFRLLVSVKRLPTRVRTTYGQPAGGTTTATTAITLKAPRQTAKP